MFFHEVHWKSRWIVNETESIWNTLNGTEFGNEGLMLLLQRIATQEALNHTQPVGVFLWAR